MLHVLLIKSLQFDHPKEYTVIFNVLLLHLSLISSNPLSNLFSEISSFSSSFRVRNQVSDLHKTHNL
jgi:hypothetical protein